jgi:hypothetical protein
MAYISSPFEYEDVQVPNSTYVPIIQPGDPESHIYDSTTLYKHTKRRKLNPPGENMWLRPDGTILSEIDVIIKLQRRVLSRIWHPDSPLVQKLKKGAFSSPRKGDPVAEH